MPVNRFLAMALLFTLTALAASVAESSAPQAAAPTTISEQEANADEPTSAVADDDHEDEDHNDDEDHEDDEHEDDEHHDDDHDDHDSSGGLGAHEHGTAEMTVAWIDGDVVIELISPTYNVFGFEYEPETAEDIALAADQTEALSAAGTIAINDEASCALTEPVNTKVEQESTHSEITASWLFTCANPDEISLVDATTLFAAFPNFEDVDVQ